MQRVNPWFMLFLALMFPCYGILGYVLERPDLGAEVISTPWTFLALHCGLLLLYGLAVLRGNDKLHHGIGIGAGVALRMVLLFSVPAFSDDFYRFIWDGHVNLAGINPYHFTPREIMSNAGLEVGQVAQGIYTKLNSPDYYTVYPPVLQGAFTLAASIGKTFEGTVLALKAMIFLAELLSIWFIHKIVKRFQLPLRSTLVYALNPLVITELTGNLHFEAFMICFMLGALWMLMLSRPLSTALFFALAICSKILPLLAFPFLIRRLGWLRSLAIVGMTMAFIAAFSWWCFDWEAVAHFRASLSLYFNNFEFNAGIYYALKGILGDQYFWAQRLLPWLVVVSVLSSAWFERDRIWKGYAAAVMLALAIYQFASPVVHPWYLTPIVALCVLGPYRFPVVWAAWMPLTYLSYYAPGGMMERTWVIVLEYVLVFGFLLYEALFVRRHKTLEVWMKSIPALRKWLQATIPARLGIKLHRIEPHLPKDKAILDIGTGNGGLAKALREKGFEIQPCDVKNISFFPEIEPVIYDGNTLPFPDKHFHTSLLITVLHHTPKPEAVLNEAIRVTHGNIVIMEDIYRNAFQKYLTFFTDSLVNMEFVGHPHTNKRDKQWLALFQSKGLKVIHEESFRTLIFFRQKIYVLAVPSAVSPSVTSEGTA